jgi:hypothetical protein
MSRRAFPFDQGRSARHCARTRPELRHDEQHQAEFVFRICLQLARRAYCGGNPVSIFWSSAQSDDCGGGDEFQFSVGDYECAAAAEDQSFYLIPISDLSASPLTRKEEVPVRKTRVDNVRVFV